jgi:hypothetical protein
VVVAVQVEEMDQIELLLAVTVGLAWLFLGILLLIPSLLVLD